MNRPHAKKDRDHDLISGTVEDAVLFEPLVRDSIAKLFKDKPSVSVVAVNFMEDGTHKEAHLGYDLLVKVDNPGAPFSCSIEMSVGMKQHKWLDRKPDEFYKDSVKNNTQCWPKGMNSEGRKEDNDFDIYFRLSKTGKSWWAADWKWVRENNVLKLEHNPNDAINLEFKEKNPNTNGTDDLFGSIAWSWYTGINTRLSDDGIDFIVKKMSRGVEADTGRQRIVWFDQYDYKDGAELLKTMIRSILQDKMEKVSV